MSEDTDVTRRDAPRVTPWELVFGPAVFDAARFDDVRAQADASGAHDADALFMLPAAGEIVRAMVPPDGGREALLQVRALVHAAYRFHRDSCSVWRIADDALANVLGASEGGASFPLPAGYVQLPRNVVWARIGEDAAPEPVDGFFWNAPTGEGRGPLQLLYVLGIRPGRPGLSLFDLQLESVTQLAQWGTVDARPDGEDFANILPGGELQGYRALTTGAEAFKLAALCAAHITTGDWTATQVGSQRFFERSDG